MEEEQEEKIPKGKKNDVDQGRYLKPVTFISGKYNYGRNSKDTLKEMLMLKAMKVTSDPKVIMQMTGMKKMADLSRTWDKISNRKEYNAALQDLGMDFHWLAKGFKVEAETAEKAGDRIRALQIILKSVGLETYEDVPLDSGSWEDMILRASEKTLDNLPMLQAPEPDYEVIQPQIPESMRLMRERENELGKSMFKGDEK